MWALFLSLLVCAGVSDGVEYSSSAEKFYPLSYPGSLAVAFVMGMGIMGIIFWKRRYLAGLLVRGEATAAEATADWDLLRNGDVVLDTLLKTYVSRIQIPTENVQISEDVLGQGEFGIVYKANALGMPDQPTKHTMVAVKKVIQPTLNADQQRLLKEEIRVMTKLGRHLNVVNLFGIVLSRGCPWLVLEYCRYGSLLNYLKLHRGPFFYNHVDVAGTLLPFDEVQRTAIALDAQQTSSRRASLLSENFDGLIMATRDLISFAYQISRGMEYLASRFVIHRDLAARNVLVAEHKVVKIADFGMARQLSVYIPKDERAVIPLRWTPPEVIDGSPRRYSEKTDVWSYGIMLWEIFSLGDIPFCCLGLGDSAHDFVKYLNGGNQMERPLECPVEIYEIQQLCWQLIAENRPTFLDVRTKLERLISAALADIYVSLEEPYRGFNESNQHVLVVDDPPNDVQANAGLA